MTVLLSIIFKEHDITLVYSLLVKEFPRMIEISLSKSANSQSVFNYSKSTIEALFADLVSLLLVLTIIYTHLVLVSLLLTLKK